MKKWLVCSLDDEHYTQADYTLHNTLCDAMRWCEHNVMEVFEVSAIDALLNMHLKRVEDTEMFRYNYTDPENKDPFIVNFIMEIDINAGDYICIWYHAYEGVDFKLLFQGTLDECIVVEAKYLSSNRFEIYTVDDNKLEQVIIDTGNEWEILDIRKCMVDSNHEMYLSDRLYD